MDTDFDILAGAAEQAAERNGRPDVVAGMLGLRGARAQRQGEEEQARRFWERRLQLCRQAGDMPNMADTLSDLAGQALSQGDRGRCKALLAQVFGIARAHKLRDILVTAHIMAAQLAYAEDRPRLAQRRAHWALRLLDTKVDRHVAVYAWIMLGRLSLQLDDPEGRRAFEMGFTLMELGALYERQQRTRLAALAYLAACQIHTHLSSQMQRRAEDELERFRQAQSDPEILEWMHRQRRSSWMDLASTLLKGS